MAPHNNLRHVVDFTESFEPVEGLRESGGPNQDALFQIPGGSAALREVRADGY